MIEKGDARRSELLVAAEKLFYTKGYEKTSIQDILDEVGFSKGRLLSITLTASYLFWRQSVNNGHRKYAKVRRLLSAKARNRRLKN